MGKIPPEELSNHYTMGKILRSLEDHAYGVMVNLPLEDLSHGVMVRLLPWRI
jgi:hypothetical protein